MSKISVKLAIYFLVTVIVMEMLLMMYLHPSIVHTRVEEEFEQQLSRGANHRDVLVDNFSESTIHHIVLMESVMDKRVVITDQNLSILGNSEISNKDWEEVRLQLASNDYESDQVIQNDWKNKEFIISVHPYKTGLGESGYVVLYQSTEPIKILMEKLNFHFVLAGIASLIILGVVYVILTRFLTRPLIRMKNATEKLSNGDFNVRLPSQGNDELGELSNSIQKLASDLERIKKNRTEFLASISHELRTPLTYLAGYSTIAMRTDLVEEREQYLTIINEEASRLTDLVKDLFDLAKMDETSFDVNKEPIKAKPFFATIHGRLHPSFKLKNIALTLSCDETHIIQADPLRLEQIIVNLLDNARKYSNQGTTQLIVTPHKGKTMIRVIDEGLGIRKDDLENIFDRLFRVEKSRSRAYGGSGLGLAIVKELVEAHNGTLSVKSEIGKGSEFTVIL